MQFRCYIVLDEGCNMDWGHPGFGFTRIDAFFENVCPSPLPHPFPSPFLPPTPLSYPLPLRSRLPLIQLGGLGSAVSSPSEVWGRNRIWCILTLKYDIWWQQF